MDDLLITVSEVGRILNRCAKTVREYDRSGRLRALRTRRGVRLFRVIDVERFAQELQQESRTKREVRHD
jgi:hypothetical protein